MHPLFRSSWSERWSVIPRGICQLLSNLLGNAIKHGDPEGAVELKIITSDGSFSISVSNGRADIDQDRMRDLFKPFMGRESSNNRNGLGLGLYICSEIAKAHGGRIGVESSNGVTVFNFDMPLHGSTLIELMD